MIRDYGPVFGHLLHAQPWDIRRWTYRELCDRVDWVTEVSKTT